MTPDEKAATIPTELAPVYMRQLAYTHERAEPVILPYSPEPYDRCGRCEGREVVATAHYVDHWAVNVCAACLTPEECEGMNVVVDTVIRSLVAQGGISFFEGEQIVGHSGLSGAHMKNRAAKAAPSGIPQNRPNQKSMTITQQDSTR